MNTQQFWQIIKKANTDEDGMLYDPRTEGVLEDLEEQLLKLSIEELAMFDAVFDAFHVRSYNKALWQELRRIFGFVSDDRYDYFRAWLIGCGEECFTSVMKNSSAVRNLLEGEKDLPMLESLIHFGRYVYETRYEEHRYELPEEYVWLQKDTM